MELPHFLHWLRELRHRGARRVVRALAAYAVVAFAIIEVYEPVMHALHVPDWTLTFVVLVLAIGFPVVSVLAWISAPTAIGAAVAPGAEARPARRIAAVLVALGLVVATPGLVWFLLWRGRGADGAAPGRAPSVAVLAFADMSPAKDQQYFADGIAEEILNALARVDGLRVAGRTSSFSFRDKDVKLADIGRELNVSAVLEGSVRREGNRVRVSAEVVDVVRGYDVWSETYDRELTGVFAVQDDIARAVVEALKVKLLPGGGPTAKEHRTANPEAYDHYLLGRHFFDVGTSDGMRRAVATLEKAVAADPTYAPAWAWLSASVLNSALLAPPRAPGQLEEEMKRATGAAERAVALAPDLADGWSARGWIETSVTWDWVAAKADLDHALALSPRDPNILLRQSQLLAVLGRLPEAIARAREVVEIDPLYAWAWEFLAGFYNGEGRPDLALDAANRALQIAPDQMWALRQLGVSHLLLGEPGPALATFQRHGLEAIRLAGTALAQHDLGNAGEERRALDALLARFSDSEPYEIALVYAWLGDGDRTFEWLDRAFEQHGGRGVSRLYFRSLGYEPLLRKVRGDPRYAALLRRMRLR